MRIQKLKLYNFSSHVSTTIDFSPDASVTMIVGNLGAGKSSILQAIEYALVGDCGYYRKRTDDRSELVHDLKQTQDGMGVTMITDRGRIERNKNANGESFSWNGDTKTTASALDTAITDALGCSKTIISAALNVGNFFDLEADKQKELIIALIGAEVKHEKVVELFKGEPEAFTLLAGRLDSLQAIANAHQYAYDRRTIVKRELKELKPPPAPEGTPPPLEKLKTLMAQVERDLQEKIAQKARMEGAGQVASVRQRLEARQKELQAKIQAGNENFPEYAKVAKVLEERLETAKQMRGSAAETAVTMETQARVAGSTLLAIRRNVELLSNFNGRCVAGDHLCPAPASDMKSALELQKVNLARARAATEQFDIESKKLNALRDDLSDIQAAEQAIRVYAQEGQDRQRYASELAQVQKEIVGLNGAGADPAKILELDAEITAIRERIGRGRTQLDAAASWLERERQVKAVALSRATKEKELGYLESLVDFLSPRGVKVQLIDERLERFTTRVNKALTPFRFTMSIQLEPWRIIVGRPLSRLSRSERFRVSVGFQVALAQMTGLNFVVCDDAEILTPEARRDLMKTLIGHGLDQSIVAMTLMNSEQFIESRKKMPAMIEALMVTNVGGVSKVDRV